MLNTEFLWLKCLQINHLTRATRLLQLVEPDLLVLPKFKQAVSNAESLVFCLMFCWSLCVICLCLFDLRLLVSPLISSNVFLQSSCLYFNWKLLKHINVTVLVVDIGKYMNDSVSFKTFNTTVCTMSVLCVTHHADTCIAMIFTVDTISTCGTFWTKQQRKWWKVTLA
jgi:hypothetical protein